MFIDCVFFLELMNRQKSNLQLFAIFISLSLLCRILDELMALAITHLSWWLWSGKHQEPKISKESSLNPPSESSTWESDARKFPLTSASSASRRVKPKWHSREERKIDREHDIVLVPADAGCISGSDSDSDWSIGWLEPHGPEFLSDDEDNSFAVLVPCYGSGLKKMVEGKEDNNLSTLCNISDVYSTGNYSDFTMPIFYFLFLCF